MMISSLDIVEEIISKLDDVAIGLWKNEKKTTKQDAKEKGLFICRITSISTH